MISENKTYGNAPICVILKRDYQFILFAKSSQKPSSDDFAQNDRTFSKKSYLEHHMTVTKNGVTMKHFAGIKRFSEHVYANVYSKANSANAAKFLRELIENAPYKVRSIQADRDFEFMKDFENACEELKIPLFVLSPAPSLRGLIPLGYISKNRSRKLHVSHICVNLYKLKFYDEICPR